MVGIDTVASACFKGSASMSPAGVLSPQTFFSSMRGNMLSVINRLFLNQRVVSKSVNTC